MISMFSAMPVIWRDLRPLGLAALTFLPAAAAAQAPPNDHVYLATEVGAGTYTGTTVGATRGHDEYPAPCVPGGPAADNMQTVYWEFNGRSDGDGRLSVSLAGTDFDAVLAVQTGVGDTFACATGPDARVDDIPTEDWRSYLIRVSGVGAAEGNVVLTLTRSAPALPSNDDRADATPISGSGLHFELNLDATREPGEADASCAAGDDEGASLWWAYTAPQAQEVTFDAEVLHYGVVSLHDASGAELACDRRRIEDVALAADETVWVRVSHTNIGGLARLGVFVGDDDRPPNDDRALAAPLALETSYYGSTAGATTEPGEAAPSCAPGDAGRSVWWRYDAAAPSRLDIAVSGPRVLSVHDADGAELACAANAGGPAHLDYVALPAGPLFVRVSDPASRPRGGEVYFTFDVTPAFTNDDRADAVAIEPGVTFGSTVGATAEADEPVLPESCFQNGYYGEDTNESAWWSYTAPADATLLVDLDGSDFDTIVSIHDEDLVPLGCDDDDPTNDDALDYTSRLANVPVAAGQRVLIRVSGKTVGGGRPTTGDVRLTLELYPAATTTTIASGSTAGGPTWEYPSIYGQVCGRSFPDPRYATDAFTVAADGFYTFTGTFTGYHGAVFVFAAPFDAEAWLCDDVLVYGYGSNAEPFVAQGRPVELEAGVDYVLVASGTDSDDDGGPYVIEALGPAPVSFASLVSAEAPRADGALALSAPRPNPTGGDAALAVSLGASETVSIEVLNALGQRVAVLHDGPLAGGAHEFTVRAGALPAGVYIVRAVGETVRATQRLTIVR